MRLRSLPLGRMVAALTDVLKKCGYPSEPKKEETAPFPGGISQETADWIEDQL